jgi:putative sterol carrier protein
LPVLQRIRTAWNAFRNGDSPTEDYFGSPGVYGGASPSRTKPLFTINDRTIVPSIYARIAIDVSMLDFRHVQLDGEGRFQNNLDSRLHDALTVEPNLDQSPGDFKRDIIWTLFDKGVAVIVPVDTTVNPSTNDVIDIYTLRVGTVVKWLPKKVRVRLYNEETGKHQEVTLDKRFVAIVENPLYSVMNEPNSTMQRLNRKLTLLDAVDEQSGSGKLDIIIQFPYAIRSQARRDEAEKRREEIEFQLKDTKYGIAYVDATEKITQLNRPAENNLMGTVEYLVRMLYGQLGITEEVMNGTADEKTMINYFNRTIEPLATAIVEAMQRAFIGSPSLTKEKVQYFTNPFKFVPLAVLAEIVDKLTRNEVVSSNEVRGYIGIPPSKDPKADQLINSNLKADDTRAASAPQAA